MNRNDLESAIGRESLTCWDWAVWNLCNGALLAQGVAASEDDAVIAAHNATEFLAEA